MLGSPCGGVVSNLTYQTGGALGGEENNIEDKAMCYYLL